MIKRYARVFRQAFINNVVIEMSFRINFVLILFVEIIWLLVLLGQFHFLLKDGGSLGPWEGVEYYFFVGIVTLMDNLFLALIAPNFWNFSELLRTGSLDFLLTKPLHPIFLIFTQYQRLSGIISAMFSVSLIVWLAPQMDVVWSTGLVAATLLLIVLCMCLRLSVELIIGSFNFITVEGEAMNTFRINMQQFGKYPSFIYRQPARMILTRFIPLSLVTTLPVDWVLGNAQPLWTSIALVIALTSILWLMMLMFWKRGFRRYESASS